VLSVGLKDAVFILCEAAFGSRQVHNKDIISAVAAHQRFHQTDPQEGAQSEKVVLTDAQIDALAYFGQLDSGDEAHKNKISFMMHLRPFDGRILSGIKFQILPGSRAARDRYTFRRLSGPDKDQDPPSRPPEPAIRTQNSPADTESAPKVVVSVVSGSLFTTNAYAWKSSLSLTHKDVCDQKVILSQGHQWEKHYQTVPRLPPPDLLALDLETYAEPKIGKRSSIRSTNDALDPRKAQIRLVSLADKDGNIHQFDLLQEPELPPEILSALQSAELVIHNAAFELVFLHTKFAILPRQVFCTLTAARLLEPTRSVPHSLGPVIERYLDVKLPKEYGASDWGAMMLTADQLRYAREDVRYLLRLRRVLLDALEHADLYQVFELESALLPVVAKMELHGFAVDISRLGALLAEPEEKATRVERRLRELFEAPTLNIDSPEQLLEAFARVGITLTDTEEKTLCALSDERAALILDYRGAAKRVARIKTLLEAQSEARIYARFKPLGTVNGRFSSSDPNLQNIDRSGGLRECFIASGPDRVLIDADYGQIELRIAALFAPEPVMIEAFRAKEDLQLYRTTLSSAIGVAVIRRTVPTVWCLIGARILRAPNRN
jgi:hypothetical protein